MLPFPLRDLWPMGVLLSGARENIRWITFRAVVYPRTPTRAW